MFHEVIVVEGVHDAQKLASINPHIKTILTGGSQISVETIQMIHVASMTFGVILFLDPDYPGTQIRNKILQSNPPGVVKIASLSQSDAKKRNGKKVGIEHASNQKILSALNEVVTLESAPTTLSISLSDLIELRLVRNSGADALRETVCNRLRIPKCNGKTFLRYLNMIGISKSQLIEVIR